MFSSLIKNLQHCSVKAASTNLSARPAQTHLFFVRTATKKAGGTVVNKSDSAGRRLGVKVYGGQTVKVGEAILHQRGYKYHPGVNVIVGTNHTIHAGTPGYVRFTSIPIPGKTSSKFRTYVSVVPTLALHQPQLVNFLADIKFRVLKRKEKEAERKRAKVLAGKVTGFGKA